MKKPILLLGFLLSTLASTGYAIETTYVDYGQDTVSPLFDLIWQYTTETAGGVTYAVITGVRDSGSDYPSGDIAVPTSVSATPTGTGFIVKKIADGAFRNQIGITSISIPKTVEEIGVGVFTGCSVLSEISVDASNPWLTSFDGALYDKNFTTLLACPACADTIIFPGPLTRIASEAFAGCHQLVTLEVPASVTSIDSRAFLNCKKLASITFEGDAPAADATIVTGVSTPLKIYKSETSTNWDTLPWNNLAIFTVKSVEEREEGEDNLTTKSERAGYVLWRYRVSNGTAEIYFNGDAAIPKSTTQTYHLDNGALVGDGTLNIPSTLGGYPVTRIGDGAFNGCTALKSITFPDTIREIGNRPIAGSAVVSLDLPDSLRTLTGNPLAGCDTILNVSIAADNSYYTIVDGLIYDKDLQTLIGCPARMESASIAPTVTKIGTEAFYGCFRLRELQLPKVLTAIEDEAFRGAERLTAINIPTLVTSIGAKAFVDCSSLMKVTYTGNAPSAPDDIYDDDVHTNTPAAMTSYATQGATGFSEGTWKKRPIVFFDNDPSAPAVPDAMNQVHDDGTVKWTYNVIDGKAIITGAEGDVDGKAVTIPNSLDGFTTSGLNSDALDALDGVKAYESASDIFSARNGCLYSADGKTLIRVPNGLTLPHSVTTAMTSNIVAVTTIPRLMESGNPGNDGTSVITSRKTAASSTTTKDVAGDIAFSTILAGVTGIADHAFYGCNASLIDKRDDTSAVIGGETGFTGADGDPYVKTITAESSTVTTYNTIIELPDTVTFVSETAFEGSTVKPGRPGSQLTASAIAGNTSAGNASNSTGLEANTSYLGWIESNGRVTGTLSIKTGKMTKSGMKVTGSAVRIGLKTTTIRNEAGLNALGDVKLVKDISKSKTEKTAFNAFKGKCWTIAYETANGAEDISGYATLSVSVAQNGKVRIKGYAPDGTKFSGSAQMVKDGTQYKIPLAVQTYTGKKGGIALCLAVNESGSISSDSSAEFKVVSSGKVVTLNLALVDAKALGGAPGKYLLVGGEAENAGFELDTTLKGWNPRYTKSTGEIKGKVGFYRKSDGQLVKATVSGIAVGGVGYCSATVKDGKSWPALIVP